MTMLREPHTDKDCENNILRRFRNGEPGDMPYEPNHSACWIPSLLSTEKPDFETSGSKEECDAGDAGAGTPHQVPGDCQGTGRPGL